MTQDHYELMHIICRHSKTKKEAKEIMMQSFEIQKPLPYQQKSKAEAEIDAYINRNWSSRMKSNKYSLRKKTLKEVQLLMGLLLSEKGRIFTKVLVPIKKKLEGNHLPKEFYDLIIKDSTPRKEKLRGTHIELNDISNDGIVIYCCDEYYTFMIHDIDRSKNLIFV